LPRGFKPVNKEKMEISSALGQESSNLKGIGGEIPMISSKLGGRISLTM
jgi:hypothetical protein